MFMGASPLKNKLFPLASGREPEQRRARVSVLPRDFSGGASTKKIGTKEKRDGLNDMKDRPKHNSRLSSRSQGVASVCFGHAKIAPVGSVDDFNRRAIFKSDTHWNFICSLPHHTQTAPRLAIVI